MIKCKCGCGTEIIKARIYYKKGKKRVQEFVTGHNHNKVYKLMNLLSKEDVKRLYIDKKYSAVEIGKKYGVNTPTVTLMLTKYNIPIRSRKTALKEYRNTNKFKQNMKKQSEFMKKNNPMIHKQYRKKCSQPGKKNGMFGKKHLSGDKNPAKRPEIREKMSISMAKAYSEGRGYNRASSRGYYNDEYYDSSWELIYMKYLDNLEKIWTKKHKIIIPYIWKGIVHNYVPDFLINNNEIHEVKPKFKLNDKQILTKINAGKEWCKNNGFIFKIIDDDIIRIINDTICVGGDANGTKQ